MRTWVKATVGGAALIAMFVTVMAGMGAFFFFRHLDTRSATEADITREIDLVRTRFAGRPPLVELADVRRGDIRINRAPTASDRAVSTVHLVNWKAADAETIRTDVPLWFFRFHTVNLLSELGVAPARYRLTVSDIRRYGPGIIVDYGREPGTNRVLIWVD